MTAKQDQSPVYVRVLQGLLRPLVRTLIARGVTLPVVYRLLKQVYVDVARESYALGGKPPTDSRVAILTGVHRRDIKAIREGDGAGPETARREVTLLATVLGRWQADPAYRTPRGTPLNLPKTGEAPSFDSLVRDINKDVRPRTVLDELLRQGLAVEDADGLIAPAVDAFVGPADGDAQMTFFARNVGDHMAAAADNLLGDRPKTLERAVFYNNLSDGSVSALQAQAEAEAHRVLVSLNDSAHAKQTADAGENGATHRFRFGVYFYREDEADPLPPKTDGR